MGLCVQKKYTKLRTISLRMLCPAIDRHVRLTGEQGCYYHDLSQRLEIHGHKELE